MRTRGAFLATLLLASTAAAQATLPTLDVRDPSGLAVDDAGNRYLADRNQNRVVVVGPTGLTGVLASDVIQPSDLAVHGCALLVASPFGPRTVPFGLAGEVLTAGGQPVRNASVLVRATGSETGGSSPTATTDEAGRFTLSLDFLPCDLAEDARTIVVVVQTRGDAATRARTVERTVTVSTGVATTPEGPNPGPATAKRRHTLVELRLD